MKKGVSILKSKFKVPIENAKVIWLQEVPNIKETTEIFDNILECLNNDLFIIKPKQKTSEDTTSEEIDVIEDKQSTSHKRKRGRPAKTSKVPQDLDTTSDSCESGSLSTSVRSRRVAAQDAKKKLTEVQNFIKATKLRRPTDFDEKHSKQTYTISSPPAKCRKSHRKQSVGSSSSTQEDDAVESKHNYDNLIVVNNEQLLDECLNNESRIRLEQVSTPTIDSLAKCRTTCNSCGQREDDGVEIKHNNDNLIVVNNEQLIDECLIKESRINLERTNTPTIQSLTKCRTKSRNLTEDQLVKDEHNENVLLRESSGKRSGDLFNDSNKHFDTINVLNQNETSLSETKQEKNLEKEYLAIPLNTTYNMTNNNSSKNKRKMDSGISSTEGEINQKETGILPIGHSSPVNGHNSSLEEFNGFDLQHNVIEKQNSTFRIQKNKCEDDNFEVKSQEREEHVIQKTVSENKTENKVEVLEIKKKSRVVKTRVNRTETLECEQEHSKSESDEANDESSNIHSRSKVIKKADVQVQSVDKMADVAVYNGKDHIETDEVLETIKNHSPEVNIRSRTKTVRKKIDKSPEEESNLRSRTKTMKKAVQSDENKMLVQELPKSPAVLKGELVKKRVEDFEKMKNGVEEVEEVRTTRVTRNATRNKDVLSTGLHSAKQTKVKERVNSATRILVHKQIVVDVQKKKKEEERTKREAKEDDAKKKKEKTLRATAEETRRKREEKLQKVAAAREAAEKEKALMAAKAEKEKEEKLRQLTAEKEKLKEEQHKKKLLLEQQKMTELKERRKQEEDARLAKLKELEEEHKRVLAAKEREQEIQKQQKNAEQRLLEVEKTKQQGEKIKLGKLAAANNAKMKIQQGMTPNQKNNQPTTTQSYEITPAREDRPLLNPKTENDYGIDDANSDDSSDEESKPKKMIPLWAQSKNRERLLLISSYVPQRMWDLFMECDRNPDPNKIFAGNHIKKRTRTSSAVWRTPPRCT